MISKNCKFCLSEFQIWPYRLKRKDANVAYCSQECYHADNKGVSLSPKAHEGRDKWTEENRDHPRPWLRDFNGSNNPNYKGENVGYTGRHRRIRKLLGDPICSQCNKSEGRIEASNKCGRYCGDIEHWWYLCPKCHRQYDADIRTLSQEAVYLS